MLQPGNYADIVGEFCSRITERDVLHIEGLPEDDADITERAAGMGLTQAQIQQAEHLARERVSNYAGRLLGNYPDTIVN